MMKDKEFILGEIKRTAALNGGKPIGQTRFQTETGIAQHEWRGVYWARWGDALSEAGYDPLQWTPATEEESILLALLALTCKYNRYPVKSEIELEKKMDPSIPSPAAVRRQLGSKSDAIKKLRDYCASKEDI